MYRREGSFRGPKVRPYEMGDKIAASDFDPAFKPRTPPRQPMLPASPAGLAVAFLPQLGRWSFLLVLIQLYPRAGSLTEPAAEAGEGRERAVLPGSAAPREGGCGPTRGCAVPPRGAAAALPPAPRPGRPPANPRTRPSGLPSSPTTPPPLPASSRRLGPWRIPGMSGNVPHGRLPALRLLARAKVWKTLSCASYSVRSKTVGNTCLMAF